MRSERGLDRLVRVLVVGSAAGVLAVAGCGGPGGGPTGPACGDGTVNTGEQCDDGNTATGDGCNASCMWEVVPLTAFRMSRLELRDPHAFLALGGPCNDITEMGTPIAVNPAIADQITMDGTEMIIVVAWKNALIAVPMPVMNMWCAHTMNDMNPKKSTEYTSDL